MNTPISPFCQVRPHRPAWMLKMFLLVLAAAMVAIPISGQQTALPKLTLPQIRELVTHNVPDSTLSVQIQRRGISFAPNPAILDSLRAQGAGPLTLAALARQETPAQPETVHSVPAAPPRAAKLTQVELQHLIRIRASDSFVARQIQSRGLEYALTNASVAALAAQGAGPRTFEALHGLVVTGSIQIHTEPGASVSLDGKPAGVADATGQLLLQDVLPGSHTLSLAKEGFQASQQPFTLGDREARQLSAPLTWAGALLTISAEPSSAAIAVTGPVSYSGALSSARCPPGKYTITVSQKGYVSQTRSLTIAADQSYQQHFQLAVDPAILTKALADAQARLISGDLDSATRLSNQVLSLDPSSAVAYRVLAEASFRDGNPASFVQDAGRAVHGGQPVTIPLMHVQNFPRHSIYPVDMTISSTGLDFTCASGEKCNIPASLDYNLVQMPSIINDPSGTTVLHITWFDHPHAFGVLHELDFVPLGSEMVKQQPPPGTIVFGSRSILQIPQNAFAQYRGIIDVITRASR